MYAKIDTSKAMLPSNGTTLTFGHNFLLQQLVDLDNAERSRNLGEFQRFMFIVGIFLARGIVTTVTTLLRKIYNIRM